MSLSLKNLRQNLTLRATLLTEVRNFFSARGYLEVETPIRCPDMIPEAHIDPFLSENDYLQASPEMCMKRLLANGFDRIFQITKSFRKGERSPRHLPEFTILEWYRSNSSYLDLMQECQNLLCHIAGQTASPGMIVYQGQKVRLDVPWARITVKDAFQRYADISAAKALDSNQFDEILSFQIEPAFKTFDRPVILYDYPAVQGSLAALSPENPEVAQRFEFYIAGLEMANGFTELTNSTEQRNRFEKENNIRKNRGAVALPLPEKFLKDLEKIPPAAGIALGIDRLNMIFCNTVNIADVTAFPPERL